MYLRTMISLLLLLHLAAVIFCSTAAIAGENFPSPSPSPSPEGSPSSPLPPEGSPSSPLPPEGSPSSPLPPEGSPSSPLPPEGSPSSPLPPEGSPSSPLPPEGSPSPSPEYSPSPPPSSSSSATRALTRGAIAGIVLGSIFGAILILSCVCITAILIAGRKVLVGETRQDHIGIATAPIWSEKSSMAALMEGIDSSPWDGSNTKEQQQQLVFVNKEAGGETLFTIEELLRASAVVLGKGSLGTTYRAMLENGREVAVKKLKEVVGEAEEVVGGRLAPLARASEAGRRLLLPITAYYFTQSPEDPNLILMPFMSGGSLAARLHPTSNGRRYVVMEWEERLDLALHVAQAIAYLHHNRVVHGNIRSSNVLIDKHGEVRLSDYGLFNIALSNIKKLRAHLAPEVVNNPHHAQPSADTYSFGILLLELLSGKSPNDASINNVVGTNNVDFSTASPIDFSIPVDNAKNVDDVDPSTTSRHEEAPLVSWVKSTINKHANGKAEVFDTQIKTSEQIVAEMEQLLDIALTCVAISPNARPLMDLIATQIGSIHQPSLSS